MYAHFYCLSTGYIAGSIPPKFGTPYPIEACGDRATIRIDGRLRRDTIRTIAAQEARKRGFIGYSIPQLKQGFTPV